MIPLRLATAEISLWFWAVLLRPLKRVVPLETLVRLMHHKARSPRSPLLEAGLERYMQRRATFPFRAPANCLERSLGAYRLLGRLSASPELVIGVRHNSGELQGHVWVTVDGRPLAESSASLAGYKAVTVFDADGRRWKREDG